MSVHYPADAAERAQLRQAAFDRHMLHARHTAEGYGRSIKCAGGVPGWGEGRPRRHAGDPDGCANDGSSCLCACHDRIVHDGDTP